MKYKYLHNLYITYLNITHDMEFAGNQRKHQSWVLFILSHNLWLIFMGWRIFFFVFLEKKKNRKYSILKNLSFSSPPILNIFCQKFQGLVLGLVRLIDAKGIDVLQLYGYEAGRHMLKNRQNIIFCVFWPFLSLC